MRELEAQLPTLGVGLLTICLLVALHGCDSDDEVPNPGGGASGATGGSGGAGAATGGGGAGGVGGSGGSYVPPNADSPLGTNLSGIHDWSREYTFVDAFRASRPWISGDANTWDNGGFINVDDDGWVKSLSSGQLVRTLLFWGADDEYPAGKYVVLYEGEGTIEYGQAATKDDAASAPGRDVIDVDPSAGGISLFITAINDANYLRNIRAIMPGGVCSNDRLRYCDEATPCDGGDCHSFEDNHDTQIFHPTFLDRIKTYKVLRFMDWMDTNNSAQQGFAGRPKMSDVRWSLRGVPVEIMIELANRMHADPWFCMPHLADDDYVTQFATMVRDNLAGGRVAYVEYSNEVWNGQFGQSGYAQTQGSNLGLSSNPHEARLRFYSQRSVEIFGLWETVFGGTDRLLRVMASQAANSWVSETVLDWQQATDASDALAIAPYFGGYLGSPSEEATTQSMSVDDLFDELTNNALPTSVQWIAESAQVASSRGVAMIAYEGGQHLAGHSGVENNDTINDLFDAANRDPRMGAHYASYLNAWRDGGGQLFAHFSNCGAYTKWGRWGSLEYLVQPRAEAPKYDALQTFIEANTPWW